MTLAASRFAAFAVPRAAIAALVPDVGATIARPIPANNPAFRLLLGYLATANDVQGLITPELQRLAVTHAYDLLALAPSEQRGAEGCALPPGEDRLQNAHRRGVSREARRGARVRVRTLGSASCELSIGCSSGPGRAD